jgi:hypothetical protein
VLVIVREMAQRPISKADLEKLRRQSLFEGAQAASNLSGELLKWTLGSLLLANGGAVVALLGADDLRTEAFKLAAFLFAGGMLGALVGGLSWTIAIALQSADALRRAWDSAPLVMDDLTDLKVEKVTKQWMIGAIFSWLISFGLFAAGCASTAFIPQTAELQRLGGESSEATARFAAEAANYIAISRDRNSTPEQRRAAHDRYLAAEVESRLRIARVSRALGDPDNLMEDSGNLLNASTR